MLTLFTLASGRSGTSFVADFFRRNVPDCYSTHEPYLLPGNPVLFGRPIYWNTMQDDEKLLPLLLRKQQFINRLDTAVYFESSHALLKSCPRHLCRLFPDSGFIHLVRSPFRVAKSEFLREELIRKARIPFITYRIDSGERLFKWSLTGKEPIFSFFADFPLSRFQFYFLQWIEIEYRAMNLLGENQMQSRVFFIDADKDLKSEQRMVSMLDFFGLSHKQPLDMNLKTNRTPFVISSEPTERDIKECRDVWRLLPEEYRKPLCQPPYDQCEWQATLLEWQ